MAWNEQGAFRGAAESEAAIAATARAARARFGDTVRPLTPLHSVADFCFAARRDVIEAVGAADEAYGLGPCWEMDYNIRAARAGFLGVWACAAYVHRASFTARRRIEEAQRFEASRHRYQDKFCARRLRGERRAYEPHCKGEDCAEFAPAGLIRIREPPAEAAQVTTTTAVVSTIAAAATRTTSATAITALPPEAPPAPAAAITAGDRPLVSCIMPTATAAHGCRRPFATSRARTSPTPSSSSSTTATTRSATASPITRASATSASTVAAPSAPSATSPAPRPAAS